MAEGGVAQVVAQAGGVGQLRIQLPSMMIQAPAYGGRNGGHMQHMLDTRADVIVLRGKKNLRLMLQPPERR